MPTASYIWVEGTALHYIDASGFERAQVGTLGAGTGTAGYIWIEGDSIHYIDASGNERYLPFEHVGTDPTGEGFTWVEGDWVHYSAQTDADEKIWHTDIVYEDSHDDSHYDIPHTDYLDVPDPHYDGHQDVHTDVHTDTPHSDLPAKV